ncbi:hypothetical protein [Micrococcus luteus]|uniref:hypothetical protein n=1 Tax=Micrococcus luteus TaxID=1270 RepID=UPI003333A2F5
MHDLKGALTCTPTQPRRSAAPGHDTLPSGMEAEARWGICTEHNVRECPSCRPKGGAR